jgi:DNA ligase 1
LLGDSYEVARLKFKNPHGPPSKGTVKKPASKSKRKKADDDDDEDDDKPAKKSRKPISGSKGKAKKEVDDEEEAEDGQEDDDEPSPAAKNVPELFLANKWDLDNGLDPLGWWILEKLDGVRYPKLSRHVVASPADLRCLEPITTGNK